MEMIQNILVLIIVVLAVAYTLWNSAGFFIRKRNEKAMDPTCGGCPSCKPDITAEDDRYGSSDPI